MAEEFKLDMHCEMILDEYREQQESFVKMQQIVTGAIRKILQDNHLEVTAVEARIKTEKSLAGKLARKGYKYNFLSDLTDILGARIITLFSDDVDRVASYMERIFDIDWQESIDKRKLHELSSFGYNSLHYICRIPATLYHDDAHPEINEIRFEIQMRSTLQHAWAGMNHDIGYKSDIETPPEYLRMLSRLAGMLELADEEFSRIRLSVADYRRRMEQLINAGELTQVPLDGDTFEKYVANGSFDAVARRIASINQAELTDMSYSPFLKLLKDLNMKTLHDLEELIRQNEDDAYKLALSQLAVTDLDIMSSTIGLQYLVIVYTLKNGGGISGVKRIYDELNGESPHNESLARIIYDEACKLPFMNE